MKHEVKVFAHHMNFSTLQNTEFGEDAAKVSSFP